MSILEQTGATALLMLSEGGDDDSRLVPEAVKESLPGLRILREHEWNQGDLGSLLVLFPAEARDIHVWIGSAFQGWLAAGMGTVIRTVDGFVHSRFIPYAFREGTRLRPEVGFYLDGSENEVLLIGENGTAPFDAFISSIRFRLANQNRSIAGNQDRSGIESYIRHRFERDFPPLAYHNPVHIQDVYDSALRIAAAEGVEAEETELIRVAALFHDAGFLHTFDKHEECGADMAAGVMPCFGFTRQQIAVVRQMILATRIPQNPMNLLDRIICDADLDYLGRDDFYPIGNRLFQELRDTGKVQDAHTWNTIQKKFLSAHSYHTDFGRRHREPQKQARLREIEALLS